MITFSDPLKAKITAAAQADGGQIPDYVTFDGLQIQIHLTVNGEPMASFPPVEINNIEIKTKITVTPS